MEREVAEKPEVIALQEGWTFVMNQGASLVMLPIEEWLAGLERADAIAPILDPILYRAYLYSGKGEVIKDVLRAALVFKRAIVEARKKI